MIRLSATVRVLPHPVPDSSVPSSFASGMRRGGFKHSGYGKDLSMYGFEDCPRDKYVLSYLGE
jgi:acyl-CoA reductase-like NAD-dependent aldehyde dehydrogenase